MRISKRILVTMFIFLFLLSPSPAYAQETIESPNYRIRFPNLNSGAGIPVSGNYILDSTIGQTAPGQYSSAGYLVRAGFQYIHSIIPFSFSISHIQRNFGTLTVDTPSTLASTLVVSAGGAGGYSVKASENHPLQLADASASIIDTLCDSGPCSESTAQPWTLTTTYGFGFNMSGNDVPADFVGATYFRQFADRSSAETEKTIMSSVEVGTSRTATITYKVNVGSTQEGGTYQNIITFTAIPAY